MHSSTINFSPGRPERTKTETILQRDAKELGKKLYLRGLKRNIVANLGKQGIISELPYWIYYEGQDVTPKSLEDSYFSPNTGQKRESSKLTSRLRGAFKNTSHRSSVGSFQLSEGGIRRSSLGSKMTMTCKQSAFKFSESNISLGSLNFQQPSFNLEFFFMEELRDEESHESLVPSMFRLRIDPPPKNIQLKTTFTVNLTETVTNLLLTIPSTAEPLATEEGKLITELNTFYKERLQTIKAVSEVAIQTERAFTINKNIHKPRNERMNASTFVTAWEMYDAYKNINRPSEVSIQSREQGLVDFLEEDVEKASYNMSFEYLGLTFSNQLLVALMVMERIVINDLYRESHFTYNGLLVQDPLSLEVIYDYSLKHLWTFYSKAIVGKRAVTSMSWNETFPNILAVGYGKLYYKDDCKGLVCIWNVKNPHHPERQYEFKHPVTFLTFNPKKHQILAVTFYDGSVYLIDIISWNLLIKSTNQHYLLYSPVWQANWFPSVIKAYNAGQDHFLLTCDKSGNVYRYRKTKFFIRRKIMTIGKVHGKIQGVEMPKPCYAKKTLTLKSPSVEVLVRHPADPMAYLVGTSDGCVFICSILHRYDISTVIQAHTGPVYNIHFNPFCNKVFLTCGADGCIRIWVEGLYVPVVSLHSGLVPVQDAVWSPLHSTILLSITGKQVEIWDLRRCISKPKSSTESPSADFNTKLFFTTNGYNVCIGDIEGNVHVMAMSGMPFSPMYQEDILVQALKTALATQPELLNRLQRLGKPFSSPKVSTTKAKMERKLFNKEY